MALLPENPAPTALSGTGKTPVYHCRGPRCVPSRVTKSYIGRTGGEILFIRGH
jgi:hypothetical protein